MQEHRIFGPPGTGKTTTLGRWAARAAESFGPDRVMLTSFTKAAARELSSRIDAVNPANVGTLHALCYRALGGPELTEPRLKDWNEANPQLALNGAGVGSVDEGGDYEGPGATTGDLAYRRLQICRAQLVDKSLWPADVQSFAHAWNAWKERHGLVDFADLIERGLTDLDHAPGRPAVLMADEAQDLTPVQLALVRKWGAACDYFVLVGDDDQTIFGFTGASPDVFLAGECAQKHVLSQSYRVPREVWAEAMGMIGRVAYREPKDYLPRDFQGGVDHSPAFYRAPEALVAEAQDDIKAGKTVMFLTSCSYMLKPLLAVLRGEGLPFHNPYRRRAGAWNPLYQKRGTTSAAVLAAFAGSGPDAPYWTIPQLVTWASEVNVKGALLPKKAKPALAALTQAVEDEEPGLHTSREVLEHILAPEALEPALARNLEWLTEHLKAARQQAIRYPLAVLRRHGLTGLQEAPRVVVGTIHSVKGGQADHVFLFPDMSLAAAKEHASTQRDRDGLHRLFYVSMTRARERLTLCDPTPVRVGGRVGHFSIGW